MQKKYIIIIAAGLLLAAAGFYALSLYNKPHKNIAEQDVQIRITASELFQAFQEDEQAANKRYTGKILLVEGKLNKVKTTEANKTILLLNTNDDFFGVSCYMDTAHFKQAPGPDKRVAIKGRCDGYTNDVVVTQSVLVDQ